MRRQSLTIGQVAAETDCNRETIRYYEKVKKLNDIHLRDIRSKITDLRKIERTLRRLSDQCTGNDVPECPIIDVLYK